MSSGEKKIQNLRLPKIEKKKSFSSFDLSEKLVKKNNINQDETKLKCEKNILKPCKFSSEKNSINSEKRNKVKLIKVDYNYISLVL